MAEPPVLPAFVVADPGQVSLHCRRAGDSSDTRGRLGRDLPLRRWCRWRILEGMNTTTTKQRVFAGTAPTAVFAAALFAALAGCDGLESDAPPASDSPAAEGAVATESDALWTGCQCSLPTSGLLATFRVGTETFSQQITAPTAMADAIALWRGKSNKRIPTGALECACIGWNCSYRFRMKPETVQFASTTIELCDGTPSYVNANCPTFGGGSYCPWAAQLVSLRDCRTNRTCPAVPR